MEHDSGDQLQDTAKHAAFRVNGQRPTRRRIPVSCVSCRTRKLKCNREKPCQNCIVRGEENAASCTYAEKIEKRGRGTQNPRSDAKNMRSRLHRLENAILSMVDPSTATSESPTPPASSSPMDDCAPSQAGGTKISIDTRSTHWDAILNELGAMKDAWSEENDKIQYSNVSGTHRDAIHRPSLLGGLGELPDHDTILSTIPSKEAAEKLVTRFFASYNPSNPAQFLLHRPTFLKQCEKHFSKPSQSKVIWVALLYGVLCHGMQSYVPNNDIPEEYAHNFSETADLFRIRCAQCITIADITKPVEFMIEALTLYTMSEYTSQSDGDMATWLLSGTMVRLALQQGYHRDPSEHSGISVFQGEMRRRVWLMIYQHELILSGLVGAPKFVRSTEYDTLPVGNFHEEDLYEEMKVLPPSRPLSEPTQSCYQVLKSGMLRGYALVLEFLHSLQAQPYEEVLRLDLILKQARDNVPDHLQLHSLEDMKTDPPFRIMEKYIIQHFYHKSTCVLHRKFWDAEPAGTTKETSHYSRKSCVSSALSLLQQQTLLHRACQPHGPLACMKWYQYAILNHDFLLAAMILSLDIVDMRRGPRSEIQDYGISESEKISAVHATRETWADIVDECRDAPRAVKIIDTVLKKIHEQKVPINPLSVQSLTTTPTSQHPWLPTVVPPLLRHPLRAYTMPQTSMVDYSQYEQDRLEQDNFFDVMGSDLSLPEGFNWDAWDQYILKQSQGFEMGIGISPEFQIPPPPI